MVNCDYRIFNTLWYSALIYLGFGQAGEEGRGGLARRGGGNPVGIASHISLKCNKFRPPLARATAID